MVTLNSTVIFWTKIKNDSNCKKL